MKTLIVKIISKMAPDIALMLAKRWFSEKRMKGLRAWKYRWYRKFADHATSTPNEIDDVIACGIKWAWRFDIEADGEKGQ